MIYYDANFSTGHFRGMGKYINFFHEVLSNAGFTVIPLLKPGKNRSGYRNMGLSNYILWEQVSLPRFQKDNKGIYIFPYNTAPIRKIDKGNINILILHDLIFMENFGESKSIRQRIGKLYRRMVVPRIIHRFEHIITVSEYSKNKIMDTFNVSEEKITVIPNSIDVQVATSNPPREKYIFHLGGEPDYKNTKLLIRAFAILPIHLRQKYRLKILGIRDRTSIKSYIKLCKSLGILENVDFMGYQTDKEVEELYYKASLFVFTSLEEGFGIPLIEAMRAGTPLLCSHSSCLPEIAGQAAMYFNPYDVEELAQQIESVLTNPQQMIFRIESGKTQIHQFSKATVQNRILKYFNNKYESFTNIT